MEDAKHLEALILSYKIKLDQHLKNLEYLGFAKDAEILKKDFLEHFNITETTHGYIC